MRRDNRIKRPKPQHAIPSRSSHLVEVCGHFCFCYAPTNHIADPTATPLPRKAAPCRACQNRDRNKVQQADPTIRYPEGLDA